MGLKILQEIQMAQVVVWRTGLFLLDACLKSLHVVVDEVARGHLPPTGDELKDGVEGNASEGGIYKNELVCVWVRKREKERKKEIERERESE